LQYQECYVNTAREIEKTHPSPTVTIVLKREQAGACMKGIGRLSAHGATRWVVLLFVFLHGVVACWIVYRYKYPSDCVLVRA